MKKYSLIAWVIVILIIFMGGNIIYNKYDKENINENNFKNVIDSSSVTEEGKAKRLVPDFTLEDEEGNNVSLSDYRGKVVILNFWASWCPPCKEEMPEFKELNSKIKDSSDAILLTINLTDGQRETKDIALKFLKDNNYDFKVLFDEEDKVASIFGIQAIPTTIIIDRAGYEYKSIKGATTKEMVLSLINEVK